MKQIFFILLASLFVFNLHAQQEKFKFGNIDIDDLKMQQYELDTNAHAVILSDVGLSYFKYNDSKGSFQMMFERHMRIKILDKEGYNWADVSIPFYVDNGSRENISTIKGITYNLEYGKIVKTKLDRKSIFEEESSKHWSRKKFSMPNVKEGSIIEFTYTLSSDFIFNLQDWRFQYDIPVRYSQYDVRIPEYFDYKKIRTGFIPYFYEDSKNFTESFNFVERVETWGEGNKNVMRSITANGVQNTWIMKDVPAFVEENYMLSRENYISKIEFELSSTQYPGGGRTAYTDTWDAIHYKLNNSFTFGQAMDQIGFLSDEIDRINETAASDIEKTNMAYQFIKSRMKWNGYNGLYIEDNLRKPFNDGVGSVSEINLMLVGMLRKLGINADPVILSTRNNGIVKPGNPSVSSFNYVIASAKIDENGYLMDATEPLADINLLPIRCINGRGRIISKNASDWIDIDANGVLKETKNYLLTLTEDGILNGTMQSKYEGYSALYFRNNLKKVQDESEYIKSVQRENVGMEINTYEFSNLGDIEKPVVEKYEVTLSDQVSRMGDLMLISPMFYDKMDENPFKLEDRKYPVDYGSQMHLISTISLQIPEGYDVDQLPEQLAMAIPNKDAVFIYNISVFSNVIQIRSQISINKPIFNELEYRDLKEFYNLIVKKHAEQIILKKV